MLQENETFKIRQISISPNQLNVKIEVLDETNEPVRQEDVPLQLYDNDPRALEHCLAAFLSLTGETIVRKFFDDADALEKN